MWSRRVDLKNNFTQNMGTYGFDAKNRSCLANFKSPPFSSSLFKRL